MVCAMASIWLSLLTMKFLPLAISFRIFSVLVLLLRSQLLWLLILRLRFLRLRRMLMLLSVRNWKSSVRRLLSPPLLRLRLNKAL